MSERPTKKQALLLEYIENYVRHHGYAPSYRDMMQALGYKSVSTVADHVNKLIQKQLLKKGDHSARSLEVVTAHRPAPSSHTAWLKTLFSRRIAALEKDATPAAKADAEILKKAAILLDVGLPNDSKN